MREVDCICGEKVVFLDPEVEVKTCANCGMPVYQHEAPTRLEPIVFGKKPGRMSVQAYWMAGFLVAVVMAVVVISGLSIARRKALVNAADEIERAEVAMERGDYHSAEASYDRALAQYRNWGGERELLDPIETALNDVRALIAERGAYASGVDQMRGAMTISLEELARQAYASKPEVWRKQFEEYFAGRWAVLACKVEERQGEPYKASGLAPAYRIFTPSGLAVEMSFDGPFFEKYRLRAGQECIVKAVLQKMYVDSSRASQAGRWVLVADSAKSSLVTDERDLEELGWQVDEDVRRILSRQESLSPAF